MRTPFPCPIPSSVAKVSYVSHPIISPPPPLQYMHAHPADMPYSGVKVKVISVGKPASAGLKDRLMSFRAEAGALAGEKSSKKTSYRAGVCCEGAQG